MIKEMIEKKIQVTIDEKKALLEEIKSMRPSDVKDDEIFERLVTTPIWEGVKAQTGGLLTLACKVSVVQKKVDEVQEKFRVGMFKVRDDLIVIDAKSNKISFSENFQERLVPTIKSAFL